MTELDEVGGDLDLLVEGNTRGLVVEHGLDQRLAVALVEQGLDRVERVVELQERLQGRQLQVLEVVATLLEDTH